MASSVFFRFKSQKEPSRVAFDGTGISVFELKREIITMSKLGDGTDFELILMTDDSSNDVYNDDTTIIPRSTTVIARRLPAAKQGRGGAARYISGKMPINTKNSHRSEQTFPRANGKTQPITSTLQTVTDLQTEEEREAAVLKMGADQWEQQQKEMANVTPIHRAGPMKGKPISAPEHPPPPGYVCYRCGEKGHWIQVCPTNDDPTFDGRPRIKRTTGIPRSFLRVVERPTTLVSDGITDDTKQPSGIMVNADGNWVIAEPDKVAWELFQAKTKVSMEAQEIANLGSKELHVRGLECSIDKRLFVDPTKTPCCNTTYCSECITNALLDDDLRCPSCGRDGILIDDLEADNDTASKIRSYKDEMALKKANTYAEQEDTSRSPAFKPEDATKVDEIGKSTPSDTVSNKCSSVKQNDDIGSKKRKAHSELENNYKSSAFGENPTPITKNEDNEKKAKQPKPKRVGQFPPELAFMNQPLLPNGNYASGMMNGMNGMNFGNSNGFMGMPVNFGPVMNMVPSIINTMISPGVGMLGGYNQWNGANGAFPRSVSRNAANGNLLDYGQANGQVHLGNRGSGGTMGNTSNDNRGTSNFANQQRTNIGSSSANAEESAYFRQPVNPHRQARRNVPRPADYREI